MYCREEQPNQQSEQSDELPPGQRSSTTSYDSPTPSEPDIVPVPDFGHHPMVNVQLGDDRETNDTVTYSDLPSKDNDNDSHTVAPSSDLHAKAQKPRPSTQYPPA